MAPRCARSLPRDGLLPPNSSEEDRRSQRERGDSNNNALNAGPWEETTMLSRRRFSKIAAGAGVAVAAPALSRAARAQQGPIKIGTSISQTGPLAATKNALIGYQLWRDTVNAAGGLLGRQVELVTYDD